MNERDKTGLRPAQATDALALAKLIDIAGEGIPSWLWAQSCAAGQTPLDVGCTRAQRPEGGFSFCNATLATDGDQVLGMLLGYPIDAAPDDDLDALPDPIAPFVDLEKQSVGTWYVNALAVFAGARGRGIGTKLMQTAETQAKAAGYDKMSIQVYAQNSGAVQLYQRLGYAVTAKSAVRDHPCQPYYTGDVLLLKRTLTG